MKKLLVTLSFIIVSFFCFAQNQPKVGDVLIVKEQSGQFYNHISFPQLNTLVKRGKIASYKSVYNSKVVIEEVIVKDNKPTYVILKKKDNTKFFGFLTKVKANYNSALKSGELIVP